MPETRLSLPASSSAGDRWADCWVMLCVECEGAEVVPRVSWGLRDSLNRPLRACSGCWGVTFPLISLLFRVLAFHRRSTERAARKNVGCLVECEFQINNR